MSISVIPEWMAELDEEDVSFIRNFLLCSGSLKEVAGRYRVSYPTVRLRLDRLIQKIRPPIPMWLSSSGWPSTTRWTSRPPSS